jgi:hypothetical protein
MWTPDATAGAAVLQARHDKLGGQERPALRVVSFHADETNRGPAFDMDLGELYRWAAAAGVAGEQCGPHVLHLAASGCQVERGACRPVNLWAVG